jgi:hypothetical protein
MQNIPLRLGFTTAALHAEKAVDHTALVPLASPPDEFFGHHFCRCRRKLTATGDAVLEWSPAVP